MNIRWKLIKSTAKQILAEHADPDNAFVDLDAISESLGVHVVRVAAPDDVSGFYFLVPSTGRPLIGVNADHHENRQRFTIAHELGHMLLHSYDDVHYDRKGYGSGFGKIMMRDENSSTGAVRNEIEANSFAAELLMPEDRLRIRIYEIAKPGDFLDEDEFEYFMRQLSAEFKVSPQALNIRLSKLGILQSD